MPEPTNPEPAPEIGVPLPTPEGLPPGVKGRRGMPRAGRWPVRNRKAARKQRPHDWALQNLWQPIFLDAYERFGIMTPAADKAGISISTVANERKRNPEFDAAVKEAYQRYADAVEAEVARRAIEGDEKFVWDKKNNERVSLGKCPDNILLMFYMKKIRPEFRENYKSDEDQSLQQAIQNVIVSFLKDGFDRASDDQAEAPTLEAFVKDVPALPPPETADERRARLIRELAELDAETTTPDADS